jgi:molybdopterin-guanine dinucleotide biosynthesis protein A
MHSRRSSYSDFSEGLESGYGSEDNYDSDNDSVDSSDSALWRQGEDYNDHHEQLNEDLHEAFRNGDARRAEEILEEIDESRIEITPSELRNIILDHDDVELFEVAERNDALCPSQRDGEKWLQEIIARGCENLLPKILKFFKIDNQQLIDILEDGEAEEVEFASIFWDKERTII